MLTLESTSIIRRMQRLAEIYLMRKIRKGWRSTHQTIAMQQQKSGGFGALLKRFETITTSVFLRVSAKAPWHFDAIYSSKHDEE